LGDLTDDFPYGRASARQLIHPTVARAAGSALEHVAVELIDDMTGVVGVAGL